MSETASHPTRAIAHATASASQRRRQTAWMPTRLSSRIACMRLTPQLPAASEHALGNDDDVTGLELHVRADVAMLHQFRDLERIFLLLARRAIEAHPFGT